MMKAYLVSTDSVVFAQDAEQAKTYYAHDVLPIPKEAILALELDAKRTYQILSRAGYKADQMNDMRNSPLPVVVGINEVPSDLIRHNPTDAFGLL